jgi:hypothetical protein
LLQQLYPKILVTTRLPYASSVLPGIVTTVWNRSQFPCL